MLRSEPVAQHLRRAIGSEGSPDTPDLGTVSIGYTVTANSKPFESTVGRAEEALENTLKVLNCARTQLAPPDRGVAAQASPLARLVYTRRGRLFAGCARCDTQGEAWRLKHE